MSDRSSLPEVRNPIVGLPGFASIKARMSPEARSGLADVCMEIRADAHARAEKCWRKHKAPMAAYWKAVAVYAGHIARALRAAA